MLYHCDTVKNPDNLMDIIRQQDSQIHQTHDDSHIFTSCNRHGRRLMLSRHWIYPRSQTPNHGNHTWSSWDHLPVSAHLCRNSTQQLTCHFITHLPTSRLTHTFLTSGSMIAVFRRLTVFTSLGTKYQKVLQENLINCSSADLLAFTAFVFTTSQRTANLLALEV